MQDHRLEHFRGSGHQVVGEGARQHLAVAVVDGRAHGKGAYSRGKAKKVCLDLRRSGNADVEVRGGEGHAKAFAQKGVKRWRGENIGGDQSGNAGLRQVAGFDAEGHCVRQSKPLDHDDRGALVKLQPARDIGIGLRLFEEQQARAGLVTSLSHHFRDRSRDPLGQGPHDGGFEQERACRAAAFQMPRVNKLSQRLAHGHARDPESLSQFPLGRDTVAVRHAGFQHEIPQKQVDSGQGRPGALVLA